MGATVGFSRSPQSVVSGILDRIAESGFRGLQVAGTEQSDRMREAFDNEGVREGSPEEWIPTSFTAAINREVPRFPSDPDFHTLVDTGRLRGSIAVLDIEGEGRSLTAVVGSDVPYSDDMHSGSTFIDEDGNSHDVPARPFIFFTDTDIEAIRNDMLGELKHV